MRVCAVLVAGFAALAVATPAHAATFTVTGAGDGAGSCDGTSCTTIRAALAEASRVSGADVISLPARAYQITQGQLQVNSAVRITGASAATTSITGDGKSGRIFNVGADQTVTISHVTIANGAAISTADGNGGNVKVDVGANLTLDHVRLTNGTALRGAGLAATTGTRITITRSLIDNNATTFVASVGSDIGGALIVLGDARFAPNTLQISDSTIAFNGAGQGPGILLLGNPADVLTLDRVTIARNPAGSNSYGAGVGNPDGANVRIASSIIAFNTGDGTPRQCDGKPTSTGGNIETGTTCGFVAPDDRPSTDPQISTVLSAVAGGETPVLTIPGTSPAVDFAPTCNQADQRDLARPQGRTCDSGAYEFDQAPETDLTAGAANPGNDTTPTFSFTSSEAGSTFQCRVDTGAFATCTSPHTTAALTAGTHTFEVRAVDAAGNTDSSPDAQTFVIDTIAPDTMITAGPSTPVSSTSAAFTYTSTEPNSTFQCALDGGAFGTCPASYTGLSQGSHTFQVRATDAAGNTDASPASRTWTVDTVQPTTTITAGPANPGNDTTPTFAFTSDEGAATFQCRVDTAAFVACTSPHTTAALTAGSHTFEVRAVDAAGNTDPTPAAQTFVVDTTAPAAPVVTSPANNALLIANTVAFVGTAEPGSTVELREGATLRGSAVASGTGNWTIVMGAVPDGPHTYAARAIDAAGNASAATNRTVTVDTVLPDTSITGGPNGLTNDATPTFTFSSEAGATFECSVDAGAHTACPNPYTTLTLNQGPHTLSVRAVDTAGNRDNTPATRNIFVDSVAPETSINTGPSGPVSDATPSFSFSSEAGATFECSLDGAAHSACPTPFTTPALSQGAHTLSVRAVDAAGNPDATPATRNFTVDTQAPAAPVITSPGDNALLTTATVTLTGAAEAGSTIAVVEGGTPRANTTATGGNWSVVISNVPDGSHTYTARAIDAAGNGSPTASRTVRVDTGAPNTTLDSGPAGPVSDDTPTFAFSSEPGAAFECSVDGAAFSACTSPHTTAPLAQGPHTFAVRAIDVAGNRDATPAAGSFTVDTVAPAEPAVVTGPAGPTTNPSPAFDFTSEVGTLVECRLAGPGGPGAYAACASPLTLSGLAAGDYTLFVRSTDAAGNQRETSRTFTVTTVQAAQNPTPTPTPTPTPVPQQTVVVGPASGTVLIKEKGSNRFVPLDVTKGIPLGSEVDVRKGRVTLTAIGKRGAATDRAEFYDGMFVVTQSGGITDLRLSEKLDCSTRARAAQKKPKKRKLWGKGTGKFRTTGSYSAATVRGTTWLVQDTCTTTLTRVTQGVVSVRDKVKRKSVLVKKGKKYTARKRR